MLTGRAQKCGRKNGPGRAEILSGRAGPGRAVEFLPVQTSNPKANLDMAYLCTKFEGSKVMKEYSECN